MALTTSVKTYMNRCLQHVNLRLETLTAERIEDGRLTELDQAGYFVEPHFPLPRAFDAMCVAPILRQLPGYGSRFDAFETPSHNDVAYCFDNIYFSGSDLVCY